MSEGKRERQRREFKSILCGVLQLNRTIIENFYWWLISARFRSLQRSMVILRRVVLFSPGKSHAASIQRPERRVGWEHNL